MAYFGQAEMRNLIARVTGLTGDLPKTCGTWCGLRRSLSATSKIPEKVTCLTCRERAADDYGRHAESGAVLLSYAEIVKDLTPAQVAAVEADIARCRELAARFKAGT